MQTSVNLDGAFVHLKNALSKSNKVRLSNSRVAVDKLKRLLDDGHQTLQVIADFDYTLSNYVCKDGSRAMSTHALFEIGNDRLRQSLAKYLPIEYSRDLTVEQKIPHMLQWWKESHDSIVSCGYDKESLLKLVEDCPSLLLRDGFVEFFELLEKYEVPLIIFSGGIGDIIELVIHQRVGRLPNNVHIISNWMTYDEKGRVVGFKETIVHSFNKNSSVIKEEDRAFFENLHTRPNVILMGDSLGDAKMDVGLEREQTIVRFGFLNKEVDKFLGDFMDAFDILLIEDQTLSVVVEVIKSICKSVNSS